MGSSRITSSGALSAANVATTTTMPATNDACTAPTTATRAPVVGHHRRYGGGASAGMPMVRPASRSRRSSYFAVSSRAVSYTDAACGNDPGTRSSTPTTAATVGIAAIATPVRVPPNLRSPATAPAATPSPTTPTVNTIDHSRCAVHVISAPSRDTKWSTSAPPSSTYATGGAETTARRVSQSAPSKPNGEGQRVAT